MCERGIFLVCNNTRMKQTNRNLPLGLQKQTIVPAGMSAVSIMLTLALYLSAIWMEDTFRHGENTAMRGYLQD